LQHLCARTKCFSAYTVCILPCHSLNRFIKGRATERDWLHTDIGRLLHQQYDSMIWDGSWMPVCVEVTVNTCYNHLIHAKHPPLNILSADCSCLVWFPDSGMGMRLAQHLATLGNTWQHSAAITIRTVTTLT